MKYLAASSKLVIAQYFLYFQIIEGPLPLWVHYFEQTGDLWRIGTQRFILPKEDIIRILSPPDIQLKGFRILYKLVVD